MARWQKVYLERNTPAVATSTYGTLQTDLPEQDFITSINVKGYQLNGVTSASGNLPVFLACKNIEVVDGANIIQSLNGAEAQAEAYYRGGTDPCSMRLDWESTATFDDFFMRFGRWEGDPELMLDCNQLTNPQIKYTYDFVTVLYDGLTYAAPATPTFSWTVLANVLRGQPAGSAKGFIRSRRIYDYTQAASSTRYIDIPRTEPIYGVMMRAGFQAQDLVQDFNRVRLNINNDEWVPFDVDHDEIYACFDEWWPDAPTISDRIEMVGGERNDSGLGFIIGAQQDIKQGITLLSHIVSDVGGYPKIENYDCSATHAWDVANYVPVFWTIRGKFPHHTFYLPMSEVVDGGAYALDAAQTSKIQLELTSGAAASATATVEIILDTIADYSKF